MIPARPGKNWPSWLRKAWFLGTGVYCGYLSGFPACCIAFYYAYWLPANCPKGYTAWVIRSYRGRGVRRPLYVPCPRCIAFGRSEELTDCRPACVKHTPRGAEPKA